jgi:hypothetical protein
VVCRNVCGDTFFSSKDGQRCAATLTASSSRSSTPERDTARPKRLGNSGVCGSIGISFSQSVRSTAVVFHSGTWRCLRPLPWMCTLRVGASVTWARPRPIASDTRAPVLYITVNNARSRRPLQVEQSGATMMASTSSRVRKPSPESSVIYGPIGGNLRISSKTPQVFGIIEVRTHPHYSATRGLSSECYCPKKARRTQEESFPGRSTAN